MTFRALPRWLAFLLCGGIALAYRTPGHAAVPEAQVKSVLLFHLCQFVSWPPPAEARPFCIGVLGPDEFGSALDQTVRGEQIRGGAISIRRSPRAADLIDCQVVFVSARARESLARIRETLKQMPTLLVGESEEFLREGGMVNFALMPNRKIRLEVQLNRLRNAGLKMSAQLLRVCIVKGDET